MGKPLAELVRLSGLVSTKSTSSTPLLSLRRFVWEMSLMINDSSSSRNDRIRKPLYQSNQSSREESSAIIIRLRSIGRWIDVYPLREIEESSCVDIIIPILSIYSHK